MKVKHIEKLIYDKHKHNQWQKYDLKTFIHSIVVDSIAYERCDAK